MIIRRFDKSRFPPGGVAGGGDGAGGRFVVRVGAPDEIETRASGRHDLKAGDRFLLQSAGGGGYGPIRAKGTLGVPSPATWRKATSTARGAADRVYGRVV